MKKSKPKPKAKSKPASPKPAAKKAICKGCQKPVDKCTCEDDED